MDAPMNDEPTQTRSEKKALEEARMHSWLNGGAYHSEDVDELALLKLEAKQLQRVQASLLRERERLLARATRSTQPPPEAKHVVGKQLYEPLSCENLLDIDMPLVDNVDHESLLHTQYVVENYGESIHDSVVPSLSMDALPLVISPLPAMPLIVIVDACKNVWCSSIAGELQLVASPFLASPSPVTLPQATPLPAKPLPIHVPNPRPSLLRIDEGLFGRGQHHGITCSGYYDRKGTVYPASHNCFHYPTALFVTIAHGTPPVRVAQPLFELAPGYSTLNRAALGMKPQDEWQLALMKRYGPCYWLDKAARVNHTPATRVKFANEVLRPLLDQFIVDYLKDLRNAAYENQGRCVWSNSRKEMIHLALPTLFCDPTVLSIVDTPGRPPDQRYAHPIDVAHFPPDYPTKACPPLGNYLIPEARVPLPPTYIMHPDIRGFIKGSIWSMIEKGSGNASFGTFALKFSIRLWELGNVSSKIGNFESALMEMLYGKGLDWKASLPQTRITPRTPMHQPSVHHVPFVSNSLFLAGNIIIGCLPPLPSDDEHLQERGNDGGPSCGFFDPARIYPGASDRASCVFPTLGHCLNGVRSSRLRAPVKAKGLIYDPGKSYLPKELSSSSVSSIQGKLPPASVQDLALEKPSGHALKQVQFGLAWTLWKAKKTGILLVQSIVEDLTVGLGEFLKTASPGPGVLGSVYVCFEEIGQGLNGPQIGFGKKCWKEHKYKIPPAQDLAAFPPLSYLADHLQPD